MKSSSIFTPTGRLWASRRARKYPYDFYTALFYRQPSSSIFMMSRRLRSSAKAASAPPTVPAIASPPKPTAKPIPRSSARSSPAASPKPSTPPTSLPELFFPDSTSFNTFLQTHASISPGAWLKIAKKSSPTPSITYEEAITVAICHGWIDGQRRSHSQHYFLQRFTPRRPKSLWSKRNVLKVEELIIQGRMTERGMKEVEMAKGDGRWERAYEGQKDMAVAEDLERALKGVGNGMWERFVGMGGQERYGILLRVETAKDAQTRRKRIEQVVKSMSKA